MNERPNGTQTQSHTSQAGSPKPCVRGLPRFERGAFIRCRDAQIPPGRRHRCRVRVARRVCRRELPADLTPVAQPHGATPIGDGVTALPVIPCASASTCRVGVSISSHVIAATSGIGVLRTSPSAMPKSHLVRMKRAYLPATRSCCA